MAEHASDYTRGAMEIGAHKSTFHGFMLLTKWGSLAIASLLLFFVLLFCTAAGFVSALIAAVVLAGVGVLILRKKATPAP